MSPSDHPPHPQEDMPMSSAPDAEVFADFTPVTPTEPIIRADAMGFVRFTRRDPDRMESFLQDFGLTRVDAPGKTRFYRGAGTQAFLVEVTPSDHDGMVGFGVKVDSEAQLDTLAGATGLVVEEMTAPGGGRRIRLIDPDGLHVDVVYGAADVQTSGAARAVPDVNTPWTKGRVNATVRTPLQPSPIFKLGHIVLQRPDFDRAIQWYMRHLGLIPSDVQVLANGQPALAFCRFDRGQEPADHHSVALLNGPATDLMHVAFETLDIDAVGQGHQYLRSKGWTPFWGIGRHNLGSQFFDYWKDPIGNEWEHYADGDVMDSTYPTGYHALGRGTLWAWGDDLPDSMRPDLPLEALEEVHASGAFGAMPLDQVRHLMSAMQAPPRPWLR